MLHWEYGQVFMSCMWHFLLIPIGVTGLFSPCKSYTQKCTLVYYISLKNVLNLQCIHNAWKSSYIMVFGNCHSRTFHMWQCLISSQVLYGYTLNTHFLFDNRNWYATDSRCKRNLLSCILNILDTSKVMLSHAPRMTGIL